MQTSFHSFVKAQEFENSGNLFAVYASSNIEVFPYQIAVVQLTLRLTSLSLTRRTLLKTMRQKFATQKNLLDSVRMPFALVLDKIPRVKMFSKAFLPSILSGMTPDE